MIKSIDPLIFLRDSIKNEQIINREGPYLVFGSDKDEPIKIPFNTPTCLVKGGVSTGNEEKAKTQYTIGSIWVLLNYKDSHSTYLTECINEGAQMIPGTDKLKIIEYFMNNGEGKDIIDEDLKNKTNVYLGKKRKGDSFLEVIPYDPNKSKHFKSSGIDYKEDKKERAALIKELEKNDPNLAVVNYIYSKEKKSLNRNALLRPAKNLISYEGLFSFCNEVFTDQKKTKLSSKKMSFLDELMSIGDLVTTAYIIVPPTFYEGNLFMKNAKTFLQDAQYINYKNCTEEEEMIFRNDSENNKFTKTILDKDITFEIRDNVRGFSRNDWKKVVCIFVQGFEWEFKDWPKGENVISILQKIKGFHLKFQDMPPNPNVKKWNVKILEIKRSQRHFDAMIQDEFWKILTDFLSQQRIR